MKEILDNWNKFINEQEDSDPYVTIRDMTVEERLDAYVRSALGLNANADDKKWQSLKARAAKIPLEKISDMMRDKIYNTYDSSIGEKSYVRYGKENTTLSPEAILDNYKNKVLPRIKKIIYSIPIVNIATPEISSFHKAGADYVAERMSGGIIVGGFFAKRGGPYLMGSTESPFIGINPYTSLNNKGKLNLDRIKKTLAEELAHAVDALVFPSGAYDFSRTLSYDTKRLTKKQKDTDVKNKRYYDYLRSSREIYAKLKVIKSELMGIDRRAFFDEQGRVDLDRLKDYLEDPKNKDRHQILRILNIQKIEDIGKVLDQIARVDQQKNTQMA